MAACRFFEISGPWETARVGSRRAPAHNVLGRSPVVLPGMAVMYKSNAHMAKAGGTMRGGYAVRMSAR